MHRYQAGDDDRRRMLEVIGVDSVDDLFAAIPSDVRCGALDLAPAQSEDEVRRELSGYASLNAAPDRFASFLGAGVYRHVSPSAVDAMLQRGEFFTAYTPYQPEVSQGTLQVVFEFQTYVCQLTELEVANASLYDGASATAEAVLMASRLLPGRNRVVVAASSHPDTLAVLRTYCEPQGLELIECPWDGGGRVDLERLAAVADGTTCAVVIQSPNVFGVIEDLASLGRIAKTAGALAVQTVLEATSLGVIAPGGRFGVDVVCGDLQAFGLPPAFGGPHLGFFASRQEYLRQMPGRLAGETVDSGGKRAFVLTLSTREQHIRRARATSNICTNHGLMALAATITLSLLGKHGVREVAEHSLAVAEYLKAGVARMSGRVRLAFPGSPTYNEFLVLHDDPETLLAALERGGVLGGIATTRLGGGLPRGILVAATELNTRDECDRLLAGLEKYA